MTGHGEMRGGPDRPRNRAFSFIAALDLLEDILAYAVGLGLILLTLAISYDVVGRKFFGVSAPWTVEISEYFLLSFSFLAAPWILRENGHVMLEIVVDRLPPGLRRFLFVITTLLAGATCAVVTWFALQTVLDNFVRDVQQVNLLKVPKWLVLAAIPTGSALLVIEFARKWLQVIRRGTTA